MNYFRTLMLTHEPTINLDLPIAIAADRTWQPLRFFNYYRLILASILMVLFLWSTTPSVLGKIAPGLFYLSNLIYLIFAVFSIYTIHIQRPGFRLQLLYQVMVDIAILTIFIYSSGGLASGMGILLVISVACCSLLISGQRAIFVASIATLAVLIQTVYAGLQSTHSATSYTHAGLLGIAIFITSWISMVLSRRLSESEALVMQQEIDLANLEQLNNYIIQNFHSGIIVIDQNQSIRLVNEAARSLLHNPAIKKHQTLPTVSPELNDRFNTWRDNNSPSDNAVNPPTQNTQTLSTIKIQADSTEIIPSFIKLGTERKPGVIILLEDASVVTEKLQQMKLAALGRLTASIAHEIRNPLGAISHAAQLLEESSSLNSEDTRLTQIVIDHCQRMNTVIENILQLSRKETSQPEMISLKSWLLRFRQEFCLTNTLKETQIDICIEPENTLIQMDSSHFYQIISNLCQNALIHNQQQPDEKVLSLQGGIDNNSNNPYLEIIDFGKGIPPENIQNIFEPFYTTRSNGTGLGLYITRELCECNRARLNYVQASTGGCCFRINFHDSKKVKL